MDENHFDIIITSINCPLLHQSLESAFRQKYQNFSVYCAVDPYVNNSTPLINHQPVPVIAPDTREHQFEITFNQTRLYSLENIVNLTSRPSVKRDGICVLLDGDDMLYDENVLTRINEVYNLHSPLVTYGGMIDTSVTVNDQFMGEKTLLDTVNFRMSTDWIFHLRTFRTWLFNRIDKRDFLDRNGNYFHQSSDRAILYPLVEMAGIKNLYHTKFPCYIYNTKTPTNTWNNPAEFKEQDENTAEIRKKKAYTQL